MEAVPKLTLISFELKVSTENTHFGPKLKQYIAEAYREDPDSYGNEIHQLEGLRSAAVRPTIDTAGLNALVRYFCQLRAIQSRFPMGKGQPVACPFAWKDLYANMSCSLADIKFEMACILYNIGALHTQLGASEPRTSADSLKSACQHFQHAAWAFMFLREQYPLLPGADLVSEILRMLQEICLAQAQECILDKSIQDTRKPSVIGSVATQVMYFYKNSLAQLGPSYGTDNISEIIGSKLYNYWHRYLSFKLSYIGCIVCLYQGIHAEEQQKMGERVAFYQQAVDKLAEARKLAKYIEPAQVTQEALTFTNDVVEGKRKAAKNENEFIYHEEVPEKDMLSDLKPVCLVSAVAINLNDPEVAGPDIFSRLVPMVAHEASSMYSEEKAKLLRHVGSQVDAKNTELTEFMSSLQLDQLDVLESEQKVPQEIVDRCASMNAKSEIIQTLVDSMNNLAEIISDVEHSLDEIKSIIQEETMKEKEYQKQMGPRPPSIVQTEISREYHKYQEAHARTNESNQVLHKAMTLHIANLRLLSQPLDVLQSKIPSIENIEGLDRETMKDMRYVVGKAREMQKQRDSLVQQLRTAVAADDVTSQLLARSSEPPEEIFKQEIEKHTPTVKIIEQNLAAQENIINKLTSLYASYGDSRRMLSDVLRKREGLINALITSYDTHAELLGKSQKGLEFYRKLSHNVNGLLSRLRSVCQVQREERAQMMATQKPATPTPVTTSATSSTSKVLDTVPMPTSGGTLKLKDYLPYMKNKSQGRTQIPQVQPEPLPNESYYPETIYPTSVRPAPVGSEATELTQPNLPDGVIMPQMMQNMHNPYARQYNPYAPTESEPYNPQTSYAFPMTKYSKPEENYSYSSYTPPQYSSQMPDPQTYTNPYYSATQNNSTAVTDSQNSVPYANMNQNINPNSTQYNVYTDPYMANQMGSPNMPNQMDPNVQYNQPNQDFNTSFAQMNISAPKSENNYSGEYAQTHYSVQYPQSLTPNMATYSNAAQNSNTNIVESQLPSGNSMNYPYTTDQMAQYGQISNINQAQNFPTQQQNVPMQNIQHGQIPNMSQAQNIPPQQQNIQHGQIPNMSQAQNIPPQQQNIQHGQIPNMSQAQNIPPQQPNIQHGQIPNMSQAQNIPSQQQNIQHGQIPNMSQVQNMPPQQQNMPMQNIQNNQVPNMNQAPNVPPQQQNMPMQNVQTPTQGIPNSTQSMQNSVQSIQNSMQNVGNPMQNMSSPMQSGAYPMQNLPNSMQNTQTSIQNLQGSIQHISNPMQSVQNPNAAYAMPNVSMQNMPNAANFSNPMQNSPTSIPNSTSALPTVSGYVTDQQYSYSNPYENVSQSYVYTNAENTATTTTSSNITAFSAGQTYSVPNEQSYIDPSLSQIDAFDKPIKSHVTGEALSSVMPSYQNYKPTSNYGADQAYPSTNQPTQYTDQTSYGQTYQNHPGYTFNATSGNYDYNYGSQNAYSNYSQQNMDPQSMGKDPSWAASGTYTSAGACETVQSPSETPQMSSDNNAIYYNLPYGYLTTTNQANEIVTQSVQVTTNYGANMNNSTYMQSGHIQDTSVTFASNQVTNEKEQSNIPTNQANQNYQSNVTIQNPEPNMVANQNPQSNVPTNQNDERNASNQNLEKGAATNQSTVTNQAPVQTEAKPAAIQEEQKSEPSTFDLLSDIDFSVEQRPLMPEIKVPQISEKSIFKSTAPKMEPVMIPVPKEEVIERPAKRDLFSDPSLLNQFTQEVKNLQKLMDTLTNKTPSGLTVLDAKWKSFQDVQAKENMSRSKSIAIKHTPGNIVTEVVPYDDSRVTLKSDPDAYISASYYKQLSPWCIPLVVSKYPKEREYTIFWKAVLEYKISCIVCLLSEIEIQGNAYWPTAKGQSIDLSDGLRVTLEEVTCTVHWTERKLSISLGKNVSKIIHYQINVFPAKIVCSPLVLLADKILSTTYTNRLSNQLAGAWMQCGAGAGRSAALSLLLLAMCEVRAGYLHLCDMLDAGCINLYKHRTNVLEDTKYLADAYRTVLFYAQGVLCSGTTNFNGEAVSVASGASILPPVPQSPAPTTSNKSKFSKESFEEMRQAPGLTSGDMKDPLNFLDPLWSLKKK